MTAHLPALQVVIPLLAAPLCVLLRSPGAAWATFSAASAASLGCAVTLLLTVVDGGPWTYSMGDWPAPFGIEYVIDAANAYVLTLVSGMAVVTAVYGRRSIASEVEPERAYLCYALLCLCLCGLLGITATGDAFNVFVFLEISSLSSYALIALGRRRRALLAAFQYLVLGTIAGTFVLVGVGLIYALTGSLNMADLAVRLADLGDSRVLVAAAGFIALGFAVKMALFPMHAWLPGAYAEAPSAVSLFLAATGTKVALYAFARFAFGVFGATLFFGHLGAGTPGLLLGGAAMLVASAIACFQSDLKRLLAYSSVAQVGYIVVGLSLATDEGIAAAFLHLFNHALVKGALFAAAGVLMLRLGTTSLEDLAGLGRRMPGTFAVIVLAGLGLIGVPLTAGFVSKWALVLALIDAGHWLLVGAVVVSSLMAIVYVGRLIELGWFRDPPEGEVIESPPRSMAAAQWALVLLALYVGVDSSVPGALAAAAAAALLGGGA